MTDTTFHADLVAALGALHEPRKDGQVNAGQRRYKYLTLPDLLAAVRDTFRDHRLAITQDVQVTEGGILVTTTILHTTGEQRAASPLFLRCTSDPQSVGSAITYGRRYSLAAMVGLAGDDDDDAQHAQQAVQQARRSPQQDREQYGQTRPVQRSQGDAQERTVWNAPPPRPPDQDHGATVEAAGRTQPPPRPPILDDTPAPVAESIDHPSTLTPASDKSIKMMWALLRKTGMDDAQTRTWVANVLRIDESWHTDQLSQAQVSRLIDRLKTDIPGGER
jgi:hypothetical protein